MAYHLNPEERRRLVNKLIQEGQNIYQISKECGISRPTIYKWIKEYRKNNINGKEFNFEGKKRQIKNYPKQASKEQEQLVLNEVRINPLASKYQIALHLSQKEPEKALGPSGVYKVLLRNGLNLVENREQYAAPSIREEIITTPKPGIVGQIKSVWEQFIPSLAPAPPPAFNTIIKYFSVSLFSSFTFFIVFGSWFKMVFSSETFSGILGLGFASMALLMGSFFFLYSLKYYLTLAIVLSFSQQEGEKGSKRLIGRKGIISMILGLGKGNEQETGGGPVGLEPNLDHITLKRHPYISIHIPFYNEKNVAERLLKASTSFEYPGEYEVIICDDSNDETTKIVREYQQKHTIKGESLKVVKNTEEGWELSEVEVRPGVTLKHLHRTSRSGFKGGALRVALRLVDPRTEFISVFDADFVPYPDTLTLFLKYFKLQNNLDEDYTKSNVAAVQGYQWHVLNKSENWITRGVRSEYAGSYVIERSGTEIYGGLKQISGSVYMIRKDVLQEVGWETSITEDFELTLKLYNAGYKVVYTPYIQAPAECVSTLKRLIRQRMRWAEGHSHNVRKMFVNLLYGQWLTTDGQKKFKQSPLTLSEKLEFLYLTPYYLQAFFFLVGTLSWLISESIFKTHLPFWTSLWGWSLVLTNMLALPLMNAVGLFLEESEEKDYFGLASFVALSYIVVPFQAYAALKGFLESKEGPWFRTPKTGRITDIFTRGRFYRFISGILPGKSPAPSAGGLSVQYLTLPTANNRFNSFSVKSRKHRWIGKLGISFVLILTLLINSLTFFTPAVQAYDANWLYRKRLTISGTTAGAQTYFQMEIDVFSGSGSDSGKNVYCSTHCNSDFSDVRFVKSDGSTDLDYWRQSYVSGTSAIFWVEVDSIPASPSTVDIYMYYGYSSATTTSNGGNTFAFFDDFSGDLSKWTIDPANTDKVAISSGALRHDPDSSQSRNAYSDTRLRTASYQITDGVIEYSVYLAGTSSSDPRIIHQLGWRVNSNDFTNGYVWRLQNSAADGGHLEFTSGAWAGFGTTFGATAGNTWHTVKEVVSGSSYTGYVDGGSGYSGSDSTKTTADYLVSHVHGVSLGASSYVLVDDIRVRKYASPEPGYSSWGTEESVPEFTLLLIPLALIAPFVVKSFERKRKALAVYPAK